MKIFIYIFLILASKSFAQEVISEDPTKVLFVGNSLTYFYDMPKTLQEMFYEADMHIEVEQSTYPGMQLPGHLNNIIIAHTKNGIETRYKENGEKTLTEKKL